MIIICEGIDCVGKSTFVGLLRKCLPNATIIKSGAPASPSTDPYDEYERRLYEPLDQGWPIICDRLAWGERVYGPVLRGHDRLETAGWRHVEMFLQAHGALVVYLHQPTPVIIDRLEKRGDDLVKREHIRALDVGYQWCLRHTVLPVISLRDPGPSEAQYVVQLALALEKEDRDRPYFPSYIGPTWPRALLFGEKRGGQPPHLDRSAFVPRRSTSGYHLLNWLPEGLWGQLGICNSLEESPQEVWNWLGRPWAVALGGEAHQALDRAGVPHAIVPHPQYIRRFWYNRLGEYGQLIAEAIGTTDDFRERFTQASREEEGVS